jgi:hypothetical protein
LWGSYDGGSAHCKAPTCTEPPPPPKKKKKNRPNIAREGFEPKRSQHSVSPTLFVPQLTDHRNRYNIQSPSYLGTHLLSCDACVLGCDQLTSW